MKRTLLFIVFIAGFAFPAHALTLGDIKIQVRKLINDRPDPKIRFTDEELVSYINEAQREVVNMTWCLTNRSTITTVANTIYYSLPNDLLAINHVEFKDSSNRTRELTEVSEKATQQNMPDYERITGSPMEYFVRNSTASTIYPLQIAILPVASSSTATGVVSIDYFNQAVDLSDNSDVPFDGMRTLYAFHYSIVYSAAAKIKMAKGDTSAANELQMATAYIALMKERLGQMPNYRPGFSAGSK